MKHKPVKYLATKKSQQKPKKKTLKIENKTKKKTRKICKMYQKDAIIQGMGERERERWGEHHPNTPSHKQTKKIWAEWLVDLELTDPRFHLTQFKEIHRRQEDPGSHLHFYLHFPSFSCIFVLSLSFAFFLLLIWGFSVFRFFGFWFNRNR